MAPVYGKYQTNLQNKILCLYNMSLSWCYKTILGILLK